MENPEYELVLLGATGYTGRLIAEHLTRHSPSNLRWAVAGRNADKLSRLVGELKSINPDRAQPSVEAVQLERDELHALANKTRLIINAVGPFYLYGTPVVEACVETGTHYLDITGETPWVREIIAKFHDKAKAKGAIIIPQIGLDSAPADLLTWLLVTQMRHTHSVGLREVVSSVEEIKMDVSGGTAASITGLLDHYTLKEMFEAQNPFVLSPIAPEDDRPALPAVTRFLGLRTVPGLGTLTSWLLGSGDEAIVHRSWGLFDDGFFYGKKFVFHAYIRARNAFLAVLWHLGMQLMIMSLAVPPLRWTAKKLVIQPGEGPDRTSAASSTLKYRAIGYSDSTPTKRAMATLQYPNDPYHATAAFIGEAAMVILRGSPTEAQRMGGGILTPATLGGQFVDRLNNVGLKLDVKSLND